MDNVSYDSSVHDIYYPQFSELNSIDSETHSEVKHSLEQKLMELEPIYSSIDTQN
jgi:hypothetical protein